MAVGFELDSGFKVPSITEIKGILSEPKSFDSKFFHKFRPSDWFKVYPYMFQIRDITKPFSPEGQDNGMVSSFYLPIPPQSMTIQQLSTATAHATIGGVVEEVSAPVFWTITLVGTTGMAMNGEDHPSASGRKTLSEVTGQASAIESLIGGLAKKAINAVTDVLVPEKELPFGMNGSAVSTPKPDYVEKIDSNPSASTASGFAARLLKAATGGLMAGSAEKASPYSNGFAWDLTLRNFFLIYQRERSKDTNLGLFFIDQKTNAAYQCVPRSVQFQKSANNPMVSSYTIILQCWNLTGADQIIKPKEVERFGPNGDLKEVNTVSSTAMIAQALKAIRNINRMSVSGVTQEITSGALSSV
jgi:hypothetical protein